MSRIGNSWAVYESPLGPLTIAAARGGIRNLFFPGRARNFAERDRRPGLLDNAVQQLEEYFGGERQRFELELEIGGSAFQRSVWRELLRIPYGTTASYSEIANRIGRPGEAREVGGAIGRTPVPIVIPCHRVVAADGALTGYGGGLHRKEALLDLERRIAAGLAPEPAWAFRQTQLL
jgi:methylated-DNA-[protein]-cysteine S-methyltransferase